MLGVRLMSRGALTPEALAEALEIQRTELQGWRLGELLVHLGYVELDGGRGVRRRAPQGRAHRPAGLAGRRLEVPQEQEDPPGRRPADPGRRRCSTTCATARPPGRPSSPRPAVRTPCRPWRRRSPSDEVALGPNEWALLCKVDGTRDRGRPGRRVRVHAVRGRPGRHAAGRGRAGGRARRSRSPRAECPRTRAGCRAGRGEAEAEVQRSRSGRRRGACEAVVEELEVEADGSSRLSSRRFSSRRWTRPASSWCCRVVDLAEMEAREAAEAAGRTPGRRGRRGR